MWFCRGSLVQRGVVSGSRPSATVLLDTELRLCPVNSSVWFLQAPDLVGWVWVFQLQNQYISDKELTWYPILTTTTGVQHVSDIIFHTVSGEFCKMIVSVTPALPPWEFVSSQRRILDVLMFWAQKVQSQIIMSNMSPFRWPPRSTTRRCGFREATPANTGSAPDKYNHVYWSYRHVVKFLTLQRLLSGAVAAKRSGYIKECCYFYFIISINLHLKSFRWDFFGSNTL